MQAYGKGKRHTGSYGDNVGDIYGEGMQGVYMGRGHAREQV